MKVCTDKIFTKKTGKQVNGFYMDNTLYYNMVFLKKLIANKWDGIGLLCGREGTGKTTFSHQLCYFMDKKFNLDRIVFSGEDLMKAIDKAGVGDALAFDESVMAMMAQDFATELQRVLIKKFTMIRSKRLFILLIIPDFFMMRKYFAVNRTRFMIDCYSPDALHRGYFKFYSYKKKKKMFIYGYKENNMNCVSPSFHGRFTDTEGFFIDPIAYEEKKQNAIASLTEDKKSKETKLIEDFNDAKLKLKINIEQWKEKYKNKTEERVGALKQKYKEEKLKFKSKLDEYKSENIELQKSQDKKKIIELERKLSKLIYSFYQREKKYYEQSNLGSDFDYSLFSKLLTEENILNIPSIEIKKLIENGNQLCKIGI